MEQVYWELILKDGTRIEIPPEGVTTVRDRWNQGKPIHTQYSGSIPPGQIVTFRPTDKRVMRQPLLEEVARVFDEPLVQDEAIVSRWVKKRVPQVKWDKYYAPQGYRSLGVDTGMVVVAFRLPVHQIDLTKVTYCTDEEVTMLDKC